MSEPLLDLDRLAAGLRFRRRFWVSCAMLGLVAGVLLTILTPPTSTAVARVLIARADDQVADRMTLMETDIALFETTEVAAAALRRLGVNEPAAAFLGSFSGEGLTSNVLQIAVRAKSNGDAVRRTQALVDTFLASHVTRARDVAEGQADALLERRAQVERTVQELNSTIFETTGRGDAAAPGSRAAADISAQLDGLYARRSSLAAQMLDLGGRAEEARLTVVQVAVGTRLVDPPRAIPTSMMLAVVTKSGVGLVLGLGVGLALAAVLAVARDRPVLRRDIAAQLGASVIAQLPARGRGLRRRGRRARERERVGAALASIIERAPASASVLEIGCPRIAAELAVGLAARIAAVRSVVIVDDLPTRHLHRADKKAGHPAEIVDRVDLPLAQVSPSPRRRLQLGAGSITPGSSWVDLRELGTEALLVIRAGKVTAHWLHIVARQLDYAGITPIGIVLVGPHPRDRSDGTLWHALHAALNGRRPGRLSSQTHGDEHRSDAVLTSRVHSGPSSPHD